MELWTTVSLYDATNEREIEEGENEPQRIEVLAEYRRSNSMSNVYLCTAGTYEEMSADEDAHGDELVDYGPSVAEIDWTGFDAALAAFERARKGRDNWRRWLDADGVAEARNA